MNKPTIGSKKWQDLVVSGARSMGIDISSCQVSQLAMHCDLLIQWNKTTNLTAITEPLDIAVKHVLDSIAPLNLIPNGATLLDMGSGGGFPGIPLKILNPSLCVTLVDSSGKKVNFIKHVIRTLKIKDCTAIAGRVESLGEHKDHSGKYQIVISRSFATLEHIIACAWPFLIPQGKIIALKGPHVDDELRELKEPLDSNKKHPSLNLNKINIKTTYYDIPPTGLKRVLVEIAKSDRPKTSFKQGDDDGKKTKEEKKGQ